MARPVTSRSSGLKAALDSLAGMYRSASGDPVGFLHVYTDPRDKEVVGFISSAFAFGNARAFERTVLETLSLMGDSPYRFLLSFSPQRDEKPFLSLGHRWVKGRDIVEFFAILRDVLIRYGSLKALFLAGFAGSDIVTAISDLAQECTGHIKGGNGRKIGRVRFFFPSPKDGSACKRMNLFLRWMVRNGDGIDSGLWPEVPRSELIVPLDTHIHRLSTYLGWTRRKSKDWRTAVEITEAMKKVEPVDPLKYDFALCHHGMEYCSGKNREKCPACPLQRYCREGRKVM